jgi:hypothetical protein
MQLTIIVYCESLHMAPLRILHCLVHDQAWVSTYVDLCIDLSSVLSQEGNEFVRRKVHLALIIQCEVVLKEVQNVLNVLLDSYWCIDVHGISKCLMLDFFSILSRSFAFLQLAHRRCQLRDVLA